MPKFGALAQVWVPRPNVGATPKFGALAQVWVPAQVWAPRPSLGPPPKFGRHAQVWGPRPNLGPPPKFGVPPLFGVPPKFRVPPKLGPRQPKLGSPKPQPMSTKGCWYRVKLTAHIQQQTNDPCVDPLERTRFPGRFCPHQKIPFETHCSVSTQQERDGHTITPRITWYSAPAQRQHLRSPSNAVAGREI